MDATSSLDQLLNAEFKEAFNEFDKVGTKNTLLMSLLLLSSL